MTVINYINASLEIWGNVMSGGGRISNYLAFSFGAGLLLNGFLRIRRRHCLRA